MRRLIVLRPEPGASATVERARALGLEAIAIPLFAVEPLAWRAPDPADFDGLLLTSANAIRNGGAQLGQLLELPAYAVGEGTADAAREAGFAIAATGNSGVEELLGSIDAQLRLLHLCGEDRKTTEQAPQSIVAAVVYRAKEIAEPDLTSMSDAVALIHSPRAGQRFAELIEDRAPIAIAAISPAATAAVGTGWQSVAAAESPNDEALLALAASLCNKPAPQ